MSSEGFLIRFLLHYVAALVRTYWRHYGEELPAYRSAEYRKDGKLHLGRADSIWP